MIDDFSEEATPTDRESTPTQPTRPKQPWLQLDDGKWWEDEEE
jgi:hypothetical protein